MPKQVFPDRLQFDVFLPLPPLQILQLHAFGLREESSAAYAAVFPVGNWDGKLHCQPNSSTGQGASQAPRSSAKPTESIGGTPMGSNAKQEDENAVRGSDMRWLCHTPNDLLLNLVRAKGVERLNEVGQVFP